MKYLVILENAAGNCEAVVVSGGSFADVIMDSIRFRGRRELVGVVPLEAIAFAGAVALNHQATNVDGQLDFPLRFGGG